MSKKLLHSKTFWLAVLQAAAGIVAALVLELPGVGWLVSAKSVIDVLLRLVTSKPVK